jgi:hypothetical protein
MAYLKEILAHKYQLEQNYVYITSHQEQRKIWLLNQKESQKLGIAQMYFLRLQLGFTRSDHKTNVIRERVKVINIILVLGQLLFCFVNQDHLIQLYTYCLPYISLPEVPNHYIFILKMAIAIFAETLDNFRHFTLLIPES